MVLWHVINGFVNGDRCVITCVNVMLLLPDKCVMIFFISSEPLFNTCDKEATRFVISTLQRGEEIEMNDLERKRDLTTPSRLFMSCDQSVGDSRSNLLLNNNCISDHS